jgi:ABC-type transport system involved in Fe-S cluster assembly fused permease/ATPase subunit
MDAQIHASLKENLQNHTVLVIAHRLETVISSDKILVVKNGKVAVSFLCDDDLFCICL